MVPGRTLFFLFASPSPLFQCMLEAYITPTPGMKHGPADATIAVLVVVTIASAYVVVAVKAVSPVSRSAVELPSSPLSPAEAGAQLASRRAAARHASATRYLYCCNSAYELRISPNGVSPKPAQSKYITRSRLSLLPSAATRPARSRGRFAAGSRPSARVTTK